VTRVPVDAQADNNAHRTAAANVPLLIFLMILYPSSIVASGAPSR
jgi:hypothetical protein